MGAIGKAYPGYLPPYSTVYWFYLQWRKECTEVRMRVLHSSGRQQIKKNRSGLRWWLLTHSWVKNTCNASIVSKGYCFYKSTNGIKRHLAVDTLGFPFFTHCTRANLSDDAGLLSRCWVKISIISNLNPSIFPKSQYCYTTGITLNIWLLKYRKFIHRFWLKSSLKSQKKPRNKKRKPRGNRDFFRWWQGG